MQISLQPELEQFIKAKVAKGEYHSVDEAVNAQLQQWMNQEIIYQGRFAQLQQEIMVGIEASERGEVIDSTVLFRRLEEKLAQHRLQDSNE